MLMLRIELLFFKVLFVIFEDAVIVRHVAFL